ncbi:MAG: TonB-dependent receptor, partial [bacterium]|nr:TonB-dependent receptor [bacterium]
SYTESASDILAKEGEADRTFVSAYTQGIYYPLPEFYLSFGARLENLSNNHKPTVVNAQEVDDEINTDNSSLYPRFSVGYMPNEHFTIYASAARTFKAPTLVHLYDAAPIRNIDPMIPIDWVDISNATLEPMTGTNLEIGTKFSGASGIDGNITIYSYYLKNEIDFVNATFSYQNIGKSRHSGAELSLSRELPNNLKAGFDLNYNEATFEDGDYEGNQLNGVPKVTYSASLGWRHKSVLELNLSGNGLSDIWADQENKTPLDNWFALTLSGRANYQRASLYLTINNLLDKEYELSGYMDPLVGQARYYPAAGRNFMLSVAVSLM